MVLPALDQGGYAYRVQVNIGQRFGCGTHFVDVVAEKDSLQFLISMKGRSRVRSTLTYENSTKD